jgi:hypothetical protein
VLEMVYEICRFCGRKQSYLRESVGYYKCFQGTYYCSRCHAVISFLGELLGFGSTIYINKNGRVIYGTDSRKPNENEIKSRLNEIQRYSPYRLLLLNGAGI